MRTRGYAPLRDYAAIGDGRTVALVARDGSVDWLCLPNLDSPSVFAAVLDAERGGRFSLAPEAPFEAERRYVPETNVLETTFTTADGSVRVTDALALPSTGLEPLRELVRRIEGLSGHVTMGWSVQPRFGYGQRPARFRVDGAVAVADAGPDAVCVRAWETDEPELGGEAISGRCETRGGTRALLVLGAANQEPLVFGSRDEVEKRLDDTVASWRRWAKQRNYDGPWKEHVVRSALALKLLVYSPSGAIAAAPTTSLPETIGGERNWDYRFCWIRDSAFTLEALLDLGCAAEAHSFFWWLLHASQLTHPRLQVLYRLDGGDRAPERILPLAGYRDSTPVRTGNLAVEQLQLDIYGALFETVWRYVRRGSELDGDTGKRLAEIADLVCEIWRRPDWGIWEVRSDPRHFTESKMMCAIALDRACTLAERGLIPADGADRWEREAAAAREFVEDRCFSAGKRAYVRSADSEELDASVLLAASLGYCDAGAPRLRSTLEAVERELRGGDFLYRYTGGDGLQGEEGAFLACSFWHVEALALAGRLDEAARRMESLLAHSNDVGLYAEEIEPESGAFLGNFPQGLTHLALVSAASACAKGAEK